MVAFYYINTFDNYFLFKCILKDNEFRYSFTMYGARVYKSINEKYELAWTDCGAICLKSDVTDRLYYIDLSFPYWLFYPRFYRLLRTKLSAR